MKPDKFELVEVEASEGLLLLPCRIRRSPRARRINLRVKNGGEIVLTLPRSCAEKEGLAFLQTNSRWLERRLAEPKPNTSLEKHFSKGGKVSADDVPRTARISVEAPPGRMSWSLETVGELHLRVDPNAPVESQLIDLLHALAKEKLPPLVHDFAAQAGENVNRVRIGNQKTRWGSCSGKGTVSLNWRLLLLERYLRDYVILHELAHFRYMNHSPSFWEHLESLYADARSVDRELNKVGKGLMVLGRSR
ncbi:MAG: SprT family zinc-dependent metalloprotease [Opitutales bacterium]